MKRILITTAVVISALSTQACVNDLSQVPELKRLKLDIQTASPGGGRR